MILNFNVNQQTVVLMKTSSVPRIGSKEYLALQFSFSSDWENLDKLVYLQSGDVSQPISIVDNLVEVPEWFTEQDSFNVTLFGTDGITEVPTNVVSVQLEKSNVLWQKDAPEPQPSWLVEVLESVEKAKASEDAAKLSETNAASSASSAQESAKSASTSALNASASATTAAESKTSAIEAKTAAETAKTEAGKSASAAKESETAAKASETASKASETAAADSATAAQTAQRNAEAAQSAAAQSATDALNAKTGAETAKDAAVTAQGKAEDAQRGAEDAKTKAEASKVASANSEAAAKLSEQNAKASEDAAKASETASAGSASAAAESANVAQSAQSGAEVAQAAAAKSAQEAAESAAVYDNVVADVTQLKQDISNLRFGDPYDGVDLTAKFAGEIAGYSDPGAWIRARIRANNFDGIHVNDYIPFKTTNGLSFKARVAGIDPYYKYGDSAVGHHIDFICEELWPTAKPINPVNYNNGLIPTENVTSDGSSTQYVLTKPMYGVAKVTLSGTDLTGWTYDKDTYTLTFSTAPAAGTMVVTGIGSEYPWLASDAYLYANSLAGHVANSTGVNPAIKRVDYTNDGIYHYLPDWLKAVIIEKRFLLNKRYSASGVLSDDNGWVWTNLGKLWFPTEVEVYGYPVWGSNGGYGLGGSIQYPFFIGNMRKVRKRVTSRYYWWLLSPMVGTLSWCRVTSDGNVDYYSVASTDWICEPVCFRIG